MKTDTASVVEALARQRLFPMLMMAFSMLHPDEPPLHPSWYLRAMCWWLERVSRYEQLRSMIWLQPRALKSITVAIVFPCWLLGREPGLKIMVATYGESLARDHDELRRQILESDWYRRIFPGTKIASRGNRQFKITTTRNGYIMAITVGGAVTGRGADFIILDDCMKADDQHSEAIRESVKRWYSATLSTRRNNKTRAPIISIQQRLHEDDLPAQLLDKGYACLKLPAIAEDDQAIEIGPGITYRWKRGELLDPIRFPKEVLEAERLNLGPQDYAAQYLQNPVAPGGNLIKMEQFRRFEQPIPRQRFDRVLQSWDPAASELPTADWSVCTTWGLLAGRAFLLDIYRRRVDFPGLKRAVIAQREIWKADHVVIENTSNGMPLCQQLRSEGPFRPVSWPPAGIRLLDKVDRLIAQTGQIEEGRVWLPASLEGLDTFLSELRAFPDSKKKDQVDSLTQMLEFLFWQWRTLLEERAADGRLKDNIRGTRPPLPPLPEWIA